MAHRRRLPATIAMALVLATTGCGGGPAGDDPLAPAPGSATTATLSGFAPPVVVGSIQDGAVTESSGLVASRRRPGFLWTHNDSGDGPLLYCLAGDGRSCGTWRVSGAEARDWEDMAAGPGPRPGETYLYLGDIGDNQRSRTDVVVYRVPEPDPEDPAAAGGAGVTAPAEALRLRYADGPHDAEALIVHPVSGDIYVVIKDLAGAGVYKAAAGTSVLMPLADLGLGSIRLVTGGDAAPDGRRVVVCTLDRAYELELPASAAGFDAIWRQPPVPVDIGARAQGEAVAYRLDGNALLATSEGRLAPLWEAVRR